MAVMSARITGGGGSLIDSGVADVFAKALFGDPEREMKLAQGRSDLATDEYTRRLLAAKAAMEEGQLGAIQAGTEQGGQLLLDNLRRGLQTQADAEVAANEAATTQGVGSRLLPVPMDALMPAATADAMQAHSNDPRASHRYDEPLPVDTSMLTRVDPAGPAAAPGARPTGSLLSPQEVLPAGVSREPVPIEMPENMDTIDEAMRLVGPGMYTADPMGQLGKGTGLANIVYGSEDPASQARSNLLYAGKTPAETAGAQNELIRGLRKDFAGSPAFQEWQTINTGYENMLSAMQTLTDLPEGDIRRGPADMRMIYSYLKMLDPNTGVKEGEYSSAREAGGEYAGLWNLYDRIISGAVLDQGTRRAFLQQAFGMHEIATKKLEPLVAQYTREAEIGKFDPSRIITERPTHKRPEGNLLPSGITDDMVNAQIQQALPDVITREEALQLLINERQLRAGAH